MFNLFKKKSIGSYKPSDKPISLEEIISVSEDLSYGKLYDKLMEQSKKIKRMRNPVYLKALKLKEICSQINSGTEKRYSEAINSIRQDMQDIDAFNRSLESYSDKVHYCLSESGNKFNMQVLKKAAG